MPSPLSACFNFRFHDAGTYDLKARSGGPNGSIRSEKEYTHGGNAGMKIAIDILGKPMRTFEV